MKINVYIDGFNLYYGALKGTPFKWLNVAEMSRLLLPEGEINRIEYFTALVSSRPNDPEQPLRQKAYLRALETIPNLSIIYGKFLSHKIWMPLAYPDPEGPTSVLVTKTEEKGSDVNIATHILSDGFSRQYDLAVLVSNDSDLCEPLNIVVNQLGLPVGVLNPRKNPSKELSEHATFTKAIREGVLRASQFPNTLKDAKGVFHKPKTWENINPLDPDGDQAPAALS